MLPDEIASNSYLSTYGYVIKKTALDEEDLLKLKQNLMGRPLQDALMTPFAPAITFPLYAETKNKMYIPKSYGIKHFGEPKSQLSCYLGKEWKKTIPFLGDLHSHQQLAKAELMKALKTSKGGILSLGTGLGKTITCLSVLSELKCKTLVIVNKVSLLKQWENEIKQFLPEAKVGIIQGTTTDIKDKDIVVGMLQTLANNKSEHTKDVFGEFGCTVVDECHNVSTKVFSNVLMKTCSKYTIGLSATPQRGDGCEYVFKWFLGDIAFTQTAQRKGLPPYVYKVAMKSSEYKEISTVNKLTGKNQVQYTSMLSDLVCMENRNKVIVNLVEDMVKKEGRKILVLSDRREHAKTLKKLLESKTIDFSTGLFVGAMKISDLEKAKACQVIFATYQAFGEGVSEKDLDTLFLVTPKKFIGHLKSSTKNDNGKLEQVVGRIFRKDHTEKHPVIVDFQDMFSVYQVHSRQRNAFYKQHFNNVLYKDFSVDLDNHTLELTTKKTKDAPNSDSFQQPNIEAYTSCMLD
jgi:superfamily II DNA or RNA helicase